MNDDNPHPDSSPPPRLIFAAPERPFWVQRALATLVGVSLVGHALGFYALQAFYTPAGALPPAAPPARWTLVPPGTPEAAALARWLTLADPALGAGAVAPRPEQVLARLLPVPYVPSFQARPVAAGWLETIGETPAASTLATPPGSAFPPAPVLPPLVPAAVAPTLTAPVASSPIRTRVMFPDPLRRRLPPGEMPPPPAPPPASSLAELPRPVTFLMGVRPEGGPPLVFREAPSGITAADESVRAYLESLPFAPAADVSAPLVWGRVTVYWGAALRAE